MSSEKGRMRTPGKASEDLRDQFVPVMDKYRFDMENHLVEILFALSDAIGYELAQIDARILDIEKGG